ncbi:MAG: DUF4956 domain-containing protein [Gemmatimonadetes bacterium]|nr:MAG: DUF4956 domain-containing protein [Gemmatimonadota bacterium]
MRRPPERWGAAPAVRRLIAYYVLLALVVAGAAYLYPDQVRDALVLGRLPHLGGGTFGLEGPTAGPTADATAAPTTGLLFAASALVGGLLLIVPVAWTYIITKGRAGYAQSVVHTLITLPVVVTGVVIIVQNSLALAFSLAGIVAAVRFRTTLDDTKDAVFVFLAIGVGLAAGVMALGVAALLSVGFNVVNLVLWRLNFGNIYVDQLRRTGGLAIGDVLAGPGSASTALGFGDAHLLSALSPREIHELAQSRARMERYLDSETDSRKERKHFLVLMIHTTEVGAAQTVAERYLERLASRWRLAEILPGEGNGQILEYLVRLRQGVPAGHLLDCIRRDAGSAVRAAEVRSLEGLRR